MALMTEAQPLIPQIQGINAGAVWLILAKAIGNGIPHTKTQWRYQENRKHITV